MALDASPVGLIAKSYDEQSQTIYHAATSDEVNDVEFARQWVSLTAAVDALRSLLEDSYVNWTDDLLARVKRALGQATEKPNALIGLMREIAQLEPLTPEFVLHRVRSHGGSAEYIVRKAPAGKPDFLMATRRVRELPVLDDTLTHPDYCLGLIEAFGALASKARDEQGISYLAFIDKNFGPVGALGMISSMVERTGLPATIYREQKWSKKADMTGYQPKAGERGLIVYDLVNSGAAIRNAATRIGEQFGSDVVAAALLYDVTGGTTKVDVPGRPSVVVYALDGVGHRHSNRPLPPFNPRAPLLASAESAGTDMRSFPHGEEMSSQNPLWLPDLSSYENKDLAALEFRSNVMLKRVIAAIWNEADFAGMPVEIASGKVIFVPKRAGELLRQRKLKFIEHPVVDSRSGRGNKAA